MLIQTSHHLQNRVGQRRQDLFSHQELVQRLTPRTRVLEVWPVISRTCRYQKRESLDEDIDRTLAGNPRILRIAIRVLLSTRKKIYKNSRRPRTASINYLKLERRKGFWRGKCWKTGQWKTKYQGSLRKWILCREMQRK